MNVPVLTIVLVVVAAGIAMAAATLMKTTRSAIGRLWLPISQFRDQTIARVPLPFADAALIVVVWVIIVPLWFAARVSPSSSLFSVLSSLLVHAAERG